MPELTQEQLNEFKSIVEGLRGYTDLFPKLKDLGAGEGGFAAIKQLPATIKELAEGYKTLAADNAKLRKLMASRDTGSGIRFVREIPFVSDDCAKALCSVFVLDCARLKDGQALEQLIRDPGNRERILNFAAENLGMELRTALTTTEIPVPTVYVPQIVELVFLFGQARQYATVFPLGAGSVKLPRLKAGEDDFGYLGVGTAGMSQTVQERRVTAELVTFTANKAGGIIRIPTELEEDTFIPIGQFLARYIARQLAKLEDKTLFLGDGTATYANQTGIGKYCDTNTAYRLQLAGGKTKPSDATLDDFRNMRGLISPAVLSGGFDAAYYLNPTFEPFLRSFNKYPNFVVFTNENNKPMFDGWPVRWIGVSQAYALTAAPSAYLAFFGALSYWYLGTRGAPRVEVSREVYFATDELAMRALERIDVEALAVDAMSTLETAAA